jgi:hypothetical protein
VIVHDGRTATHGGVPARRPAPFETLALNQLEMGQGCGAGEGGQAVGEVVAQDGARDDEALQGRQREDRLEL